MLGYPPEVAWTTPVPELVVSYKAKIKWVRICNGEDVRPPAQRIAEALRQIGK